MVDVVGGGDVNDVDVVAVNQLLPVGFHRLIAPLACEGFGSVLVSGADCCQLGFVLQVEEVRDLAEGVGVGSAHEAIPDKSYAKWFFLSHDLITWDFCVFDFDEVK